MWDGIYDGILYADAKFVPVAPIAGDVPCLSFGGLSKVHRACGWRVGWAVLSADPMRSGEFHHALDLLGPLRLCAHVPGQFGIPAALPAGAPLAALCQPNSRLYVARRPFLSNHTATEPPNTPTAWRPLSASTALPAQVDHE